MLYVDEGEALNKIMERAGQTIGETLRRAAVGETIGQGNAGERYRVVPRGTYSLGVIIGYQPERIGPLLDEAVVGTPQRFTFCSAIDPHIPPQPRITPGRWRSPTRPARG